ncbi:MAG: DUF6814 family protein [Sphingobacterium sp.]
MNNLKKLLGIVWILLAIYTAYFSIFELALPKISTGHQEDLVFGIIILCRASTTERRCNALKNTLWPS